jgi:cytochrome P450/nitrite reductase/ring-hydroxylating ferredoxin subunit
MPDSWTRVARLPDLAGDGPFALSADGVDLVLVRVGSEYRAYAGRCPHQGALLGEGELDGDTLVCRNHRWRFDAATGRRQGGPECLAACPLARRGDELWADTSSLRDAGARDAGAAVGRAMRRVEDLPGPTPLPFVGNMHQIDPSRLHLDLERWAAEYGDLYLYRLGPNRIVTVSRPDLIEAVLRDRPETFRRPPNVEPIFRELGVDGVFSAEGAAWRPQRRLAMQALSHRNLRGFFPALAEVAARLRRRWEAKADAGATLDVAAEMKRFTVDVTTRLVFGHDVDTIGREDDVIQRRLGHVFPAFNRRLFALLPTWRWVRMPADRRVDRAVAELHAWLVELIAASRARLAADPARAGQPENFLESMLAARDAEGRPFADDVVIGNAMTMLLAGEDTTAYTLAWAVHHLCDAPEAAERLRAEADASLGAEAVPADIDLADRLTFAGAVASETMRLRPVAPFTLLAANVDTVVGDVAVPRGTWVATLFRVPTLDAHHFGDPLAFRPARWLGEVPNEGPAPLAHAPLAHAPLAHAPLAHAPLAHAPFAHAPATHLPFGSGPRICPGRSLALLEMRVVLAMLYGSFDVARVGDGAAVREAFAFTMHPVGLRARLRRRAYAGMGGLPGRGLTAAPPSAPAPSP